MPTMDKAANEVPSDTNTESKSENGKSQPATEKPASERIAALLADLKPQRKALLAIIDYCREERTSAEIDEMLKPLLAWRRSVYTTVNLRSMLERAGALVYRDNDEAPEQQTDETGALVIPQAADEAIGTWVATPEGIAALESDDPYAELKAALDSDAQFADVYASILLMCADAKHSISEIEGAVDDDDRLDTKKHEAGYFVGKLEDIGALEWRDGWATTDIGEEYLSQSQVA